MKALDLITGALLVVGGLNWGLVAIAEFDLVAAIVAGVRRDERAEPDRLRPGRSFGRLPGDQAPGVRVCESATTPAPPLPSSPQSTTRRRAA